MSDDDIEEIEAIDEIEDLEILPSFSDLFEEEASQGESGHVDRETFEDITVFQGPARKNIYSERYYKSVLHGEGEISQRLHSALANFLKAKDSQDKTMYRGRLEPVVWDFISDLAQKVGNAMSLDKRMFLRYALLLPSLINKAQKDNLSTIIWENTHGEPVHYMDEWIEMVCLGEVQPLGSDEEPIKASKKRTGSGLRLKRDKYKSIYDGRLTSLKSIQKKRSIKEKAIVDNIKSISKHSLHPAIPAIEMSYSVIQKTALTELISSARALQTLDREHSVLVNEARAAKENLDKVLIQMDEEPTETVNPGILRKEVNNLRQIHKMCVGRQGNHFPLLHGSYITSNFNDLATREQVLKVMKYVEEIDPGVFRRIHRRESHRIVPHIIIVPCYGDKGICWEPFEKLNRASSRGRVAVPLYPKNLKLSIVTALADLRWEVAKEKAQYYWMEEGITGKYFQWFDEKKLRGDVKQRFIQDYILWITKESEGTQKLDKEVRGIFWRNLPFPKEKREFLRNRGFVYSELYKKDVNRELSDGY